MFVARKIKAGQSSPRSMWGRLINYKDPSGSYGEDNLRKRAETEAKRYNDEKLSKAWFEANSNPSAVFDSDVMMVTWSDFEPTENEFGTEIP